MTWSSYMTCTSILVVWLPLILWLFWVTMIIVDCAPLFHSTSIACDASAYKNVANLTNGGAGAAFMLFYLLLGFFALMRRDWRRLSYFILTIVLMLGLRYPWLRYWQGSIDIP